MIAAATVVACIGGSACLSDSVSVSVTVTATDVTTTAAVAADDSRW